MTPEPSGFEPRQPGADATRRPDETAIGEVLVRFAPLAAILLVVVGFTVRVVGLSEYWLNPDEGIYYSTLTWPSFERFWTEVMANAHPPAFYLLLRGLGYLTWDFVLLRGVSTLFGVAAIWMFWLVGRELGGSGPRGAVAGVVAAAFLALNPNAIALSQILRPYAALLFLLAAGLLALLRYRSEPTDRKLIAYAALLSLGVLCHYSAALGIGALSAVLAHDLLSGRLRGEAAVKLVAAHAVPSLLFAGLYVFHVRTALASDLMDDALGPGGWLSGWLISSPQEAWRNLVWFQDFHVSPALRLPSALLLLAAIVVSATTRDRLVAVLAVAALAVAVTVSALGAYPFGESRHNAWLTVFTIPALGWLAGYLVTAPRRRALVGGTAVLLLFVAGIAVEPTVDVPGAEVSDIPTTATEERLIRRADIAPLVVERLDLGGEPRTIVMAEQTYNVLMPLYAIARQAASSSADSTLLQFGYGTRRIVVVRTWDWTGARELGRRLALIPEALPEVGWDGRSPILVVAGGWGSSLLPQVPGLMRDGVVVEQTSAFGTEPNGRPTVRMIALVVDPVALAAYLTRASEPTPTPAPGTPPS